MYRNLFVGQVSLLCRKAFLHFWGKLKNRKSFEFFGLEFFFQNVKKMALKPLEFSRTIEIIVICPIMYITWPKPLLIESNIPHVLDTCVPVTQNRGTDGHTYRLVPPAS